LNGGGDKCDIENVVGSYYNELGSFEKLPSLLLEQYNTEVKEAMKAILLRRMSDPNEKARLSVALREYVLDDMKRNLTSQGSLILTKYLFEHMNTNTLSVCDIYRIVLIYYDEASEKVKTEDPDSSHDEVMMECKLPRRFIREFRHYASHQLDIMRTAVNARTRTQ